MFGGLSVRRINYAKITALTVVYWQVLCYTCHSFTRFKKSGDLGATFYRAIFFSSCYIKNEFDYSLEHPYSKSANSPITNNDSISSSDYDCVDI